jgi:hypothetical protein
MRLHIFLGYTGILCPSLLGLGYVDSPLLQMKFIFLIFISSQGCIGQRFSLIEIKSFIYTLVTTFEFRLTERKIVPSNVYVDRTLVRFGECLTDCLFLQSPYKTICLQAFP